MCVLIGKWVLIFIGHYFCEHGLPLCRIVKAITKASMSIISSCPLSHLKVVAIALQKYSNKFQNCNSLANEIPQLQ